MSEELAVGAQQFATLAAAWRSTTEPVSDTRPAERDEAMQGMAAARQELVDRRQWVSGPSSIMSVLGISRNEVINCRMVRWLFDPLARHGIGTLMLRSLGDRLGFEVTQPEAAIVEVEVTQTGTSEHVAAGITPTRADLVITLPTVEIVFEAKIDAGEGDTQAKRLEQHWPDAHTLVFLTRHGDRPPGTSGGDPRWRPLSWRWLAEAADTALRVPHENNDESTEASRDAVRLWTRSVRRSLG